MLWTLFLGLFAALFSTATAQSANALVRDPDTGLTFTSNFQLYKADGRGITFRVAIPEHAEPYTLFDVVVQLVVPNDVGWAGLAWGGSMPRNPLLVTWRGNNNSPVISGRWANGHIMPQPTTLAQYSIINAGTKSNGTHWQVTALCRGCSAWESTNGAWRFLSPRGGNRLAFAYSPNRPSNAGSPDSPISIHEVHGYWQHDFQQAKNPDFDALVQRLL